MKLLKKSASVKQLYNSVLDALRLPFALLLQLLFNDIGRTISRTKGDLMPELTKTFFEKILRDSERQDLQVHLHLGLGLGLGEDETENQFRKFLCDC